MVSAAALHRCIALLVLCGACLQSSALQDVQHFEITPSSNLIRVERRVDPLLNLTAVTYDEMVSKNAAQGLPVGRDYWDTLVEVSKYHLLVSSGLNCAGSCTFSYIWEDHEGKTQETGVGSLTRMYKLTACRESDCKCPGELFMTRPSMQATISMNTCAVAPALLKEQKLATPLNPEPERPLLANNKVAAHVVTSHPRPLLGVLKQHFTMRRGMCALSAMGLALGMWGAKKRAGSLLNAAGS